MSQTQNWRSMKATSTARKTHSRRPNTITSRGS